jgi:anthranilate phosphoribosyltransferase
MVVHGQIPDQDGVHIDGLDELSTSGPSRVSEVSSEGLASYELKPHDLGLTYSHPNALRAESPEASAGLIQSVLRSEPGPPREIVALNAAAALVIAGLAADLGEGLNQACAAIDRGQAQAVLDDLVRVIHAATAPSG